MEEKPFENFLTLKFFLHNIQAYIILPEPNNSSFIRLAYIILSQYLLFCFFHDFLFFETLTAIKMDQIVLHQRLIFQHLTMLLCRSYCLLSKLAIISNIFIGNYLSKDCLTSAYIYTISNSFFFSGFYLFIRSSLFFFHKL